VCVFALPPNATPLAAPPDCPFHPLHPPVGDFECMALEIGRKKFRCANEFLQRTWPQTLKTPHAHAYMPTLTRLHCHGRGSAGWGGVSRGVRGLTGIAFLCVPWFADDQVACGIKPLRLSATASPAFPHISRLFRPFLAAFLFHLIKIICLWPRRPLGT